MKPVLVIGAILALGLSHALAQRLPDTPMDPSTLPVLHGSAMWTLGCQDPHTLMWLKDELGGQPVRVESHVRMAQLHCTIVASSEPLRLWHEYTYVGLSGEVQHGPKLAQIITKSMGGLILFVMRGEIAPEKNYVTEITPN